MTKNIPVIILAGGLGTRLSEETNSRPKPMVLLDKKPILWHIMQIYKSQGFTNFYIATGYKHEVVDKWVNENLDIFNEYGLSVTVIFTGNETQTSGRLRMCFENINCDQFLFTYGDGLANVNIINLIKFHNSHKKIATVTSVRPPARFGHITSHEGLVTHFGEKNQTDAGWINGGFFAVNVGVLNYLTSDQEPFEQEPMSKLVAQGELMTYQHNDFWQPMDTLREKKILEELAKEEKPIWMRIT